MNNLWLVIKREYITRVRRRAFILATLLTPLGLGVFFLVVTLIFSYENDETQRIAVIDEGNLFEGGLADGRGIYFDLTDKNLEELRESTQNKENDYSGILVVPAFDNPNKRNFSVNYYSDTKMAIDLQSVLEGRIERALRRYKLEAFELNEQLISSLDTEVRIGTRTITPSEAGEEEADNKFVSEIGAAIGTAMGFIMYMTVFIYGMMVMRSVMEEKTNRIVEVVVSSVKPFTLMLGKIIGVGAVGLTQVVAWAITIPLTLLLLVSVFGVGLDPDSAQAMVEQSGTDFDQAQAQSMVEEALAGLSTINWWLIVPAFIIYFLGGYFMYAALFAAVGSAMGDDLGEGQALTIPITIPVALAFYIMIVALRAPNSSLAIWSSLFPLFSPIVMPARLPFDPPFWQVGLSLVLLVLAAIGLVWMSGRIYRIGILNYGKKGSLGLMVKWFFQNN
ncbi:MAG: ABC transporter permease [Bacteroidota bacterium]